MEIDKLSKGAKIAVEECLEVKPEERVVVVTDLGKLEIARAFLNATHELGADAVMTVMKPRKHHAEEPPENLIGVMRDSDVIIIPTTYSLTHSKSRIEATKAGARVASMPGITEDMMTVGGLTANYMKVAERGEKLAKSFEEAKLVRLSTAAGTSLTMGIADLSPEFDSSPHGIKAGWETGRITKPGELGNLPSGEMFAVPAEESTNGVLVVDGSMAPLGKLKEPIKITIKNGRIINIDGKSDASELKEHLESVNDPSAYLVCELGIGTNEKARLIGKILEDEKVLGTVHVAFGMNKSFGGTIESKTHNDGIVLQPTLEIDGKVIIDKGNIII